MACYTPVDRIEKADITANSISKVANFVRLPLESLPYFLDTILLTIQLVILIYHRLNFSEDVAAAGCDISQVPLLLAAKGCIR
jgi:hypothetical protein